ncbi:hypothetical protein Tco_0166896, partial [Tanacetum coccineum]
EVSKNEKVSKVGDEERDKMVENEMQTDGEDGKGRDTNMPDMNSGERNPGEDEGSVCSGEIKMGKVNEAAFEDTKEVEVGNINVRHAEYNINNNNGDTTKRDGANGNINLNNIKCGGTKGEIPLNMEESKLTDMEGDVECNIDIKDKLDLGMEYGPDEGGVRNYGPHVDQELGQIDGSNVGIKY